MDHGLPAVTIVVGGGVTALVAAALTGAVGCDEAARCLAGATTAFFLGVAEQISVAHSLMCSPIPTLSAGREPLRPRRRRHRRLFLAALLALVCVGTPALLALRWPGLVEAIAAVGVIEASLGVVMAGSLRWLLTQKVVPRSQHERLEALIEDGRI